MHRNQMTLSQKQKLVFWFLLYLSISLIFLSYAVHTMIIEKNSADTEYTKTLNQTAFNGSDKAYLPDTAVLVNSGVYIETIKHISLKSGTFRTEFIVWFRWENHDDITFTENNLRIRNGTINHMEVVENYHKNSVHYQSMRIDATISKKFTTACFPLGSQVLSIYISPMHYTSDDIRFIPDTENSGVNTNLSSAGYSLIRNDIISSSETYLNTMGNPWTDAPESRACIVTVLELNRHNWGIFLQCFIALFGTVGWVLIGLYICTFHQVDPIKTLPPALFGAISNLIVVSNLLPDMVQFGLVEYMNFYGILTILAGTLSIIQINRLRNDNNAYANTFGRIMFFTLLILSIAGMCIMPAVTYRWR